MSTFHSLSKLRIHTSRTLQLLKEVTAEMGAAFRTLRDKAKHSLTVTELSRDVQARVRNQNRRLHNQGSASSAPAAQSKIITLNLHTVKNHLLEQSSGKPQILEDTRDLGQARDARELRCNEVPPWGISREN
jgi:hypothetical protein